MKKLKGSIEDMIDKDLEAYDNAQTEEEKSKLLISINKKVGMLHSIDKQDNENARASEQLKTEKLRQKFETERLKMEKERFKKEQDIASKKLELEKSRVNDEINLNHDRLCLEKAKTENERFFDAEKLAEEKRHNRNQIIIAVLGVAIPAVITIASKCIYAKLALNAQNHDYKDYVMESKYSKEQRDNLNK